MGVQAQDRLWVLISILSRAGCGNPSMILSLAGLSLSPMEPRACAQATLGHCFVLVGSDRGQGSREEALVGLGERQGGVQRVRECVLGSQQEAGLGFCSPTSFQSWLSHGVSGLSLKNHCSCGWCHGAQTFSCGHTSSDSACNCGIDISPNTLPEYLPCLCSWSGQPCRGLALPGPVPRCRCPPLQLCGWARGTGRQEGKQGLFYLLLPSGRRR